jgi:hypothetical protein
MIRLMLINFLMPAGYHLKRLPKPYKHKVSKKKKPAQLELPVPASGS